MGSEVLFPDQEANCRFWPRSKVMLMISFFNWCSDFVYPVGIFNEVYLVLTPVSYYKVHTRIGRGYIAQSGIRDMAFLRLSAAEA